MARLGSELMDVTFGVARKVAICESMRLLDISRVQFVQKLQTLVPVGFIRYCLINLWRVCDLN